MVQTDMACSPAIQRYFDDIEDKTQAAFTLAQKARSKGYDPEQHVEVKLAKNMAERVVGIISVVAPQVIGSGVTERIIELEKEYGSQDWRVAFRIALEIAEQKYCSFDSKLEAIEVGVRTGFAYVTVGVVSSPLEGLTSIEVKKRRDGQGEYFRLNYAGPIRNAGGTAAAVSVLIADYVRKHLGYAKYDPDEREVQRCYAELEDYHQYVANLQYYPFKEESEFLMRRIPVEIAGDPSERRELSNAGLKDLPRVETNLLRSGYCLIHSSCIPLKAPKLWKKLGEWGHEMGMDDWDFLEEHISLQKELKKRIAESTTDKKDDSGFKVKPDGVFVADLVGGRPVLGHPMRSGAFRLRYGRSRASGYSGQSAHPATLVVLNDMIATGTQLKVERPGKAAAFTPCDAVMGPIVKLDDGSVLLLEDVSLAREVRSRVKEILYLGDVLINYGDFYDRAHVLVPPGYVEEYWALEVQEALRDERLPDSLREALRDPLRCRPSFAQAKEWCSSYSIPLHPRHLFFYKELSMEQVILIARLLLESSYALGRDPRLTFPLTHPGKRSLELLGVPHRVEGELGVIEGDVALALLSTLRVRGKEDARGMLAAAESFEGDSFSFVAGRAPFTVKDKSGLFIGARMGRPEKAKMRKMTGSPHALFPVGGEGGRLRSFQSALEKGRITAEFPVYVCGCGRRTPLPVCDRCGERAVRQLIHPQSKEEFSPREADGHPDVSFMEYKRWSVPVRELFDHCLLLMGTKVYPDLVKGVRGTVGRDHTPEHLMKGLLRAKHDVHVNKDGTTRYDASEITLTHFKPREIGTGVARLRELGYEKDIFGVPLERDDQVLELRAQDLVLPACPDSPDDGADKVLVNTSRFIDELLEKLYGLRPYYNASSRDDLVGHLVVGLAPHTSAGMVGRIIGFSKTQGFFAHPLYHAAMRRDCFAFGSMIPLKIGGRWSLERIGDVVESLNPSKVVDSFGTLEASGKGYMTLGLEGGEVVEVPVNNFTRHEPQPMVVLKTNIGRSIKTTADHKHLVRVQGVDVVKAAGDIVIGDFLRVVSNSIGLHDVISIFGGVTDGLVVDEVVSIERLAPEVSYCLNVPGNQVIVDGILTKQCDGDESCFFLLMDAFLNFSRHYLSTSRGSTMDAPLVLTSLLNPAEVDDMAFNVDIVDRYPLEFYRACEQYRYPWEVKIKKINEVLFTPAQFEGMLFTHDTSDINEGVLCSSYKLLPSMGEKIAAQMDLAEKIRAVDTADVARLVIEKHFIRDTKGNLRKFSLQQFRCVGCNEKFRRPPLRGKCTACGGRVIFTISEGSVVKYLEPSLMLAEKYDLDPYLRQTLELTRVRIESYFGKDKEKQTGLGDWLAGA